MDPLLFIPIVGVATLVVLAMLVHRRQRAAEAHATRTLDRLRRHHAAYTARAAEIVREVAAFYSLTPRPPAHS